jgi:hypothetical protein
VLAGPADEAAEPNHAPQATQVPGRAHQQIPDLDVRPGRGMEQKQQQQQARAGDEPC